MISFFSRLLLTMSGKLKVFVSPPDRLNPSVDAIPSRPAKELGKLLSFPVG